MAKPAVTLYTVKGSPLTTSELDTNFTNLRDSTIGFTVGSDTATIDLNSALTITAGTGISLTLNTTTDSLEIAGTASNNSFTNIAVAGQSTVVADSSTDTLTLAAGSGIAITTNATTDTVTVASTINSFSRISVAGQLDVVADSSADTLTLVAGTNISMTTSAGGDSITINNTATPPNTFGTVAVSGQSNVVADSSTDTLTLVAGTGIAITTDATTDAITIVATGATAGALLNVVEDTTPQLGGDLDVNGNSIVSVSNQNISISPNGTGQIILDGVKWPAGPGTLQQYLKYSGTNESTWQTLDIADDTAPQLGGNLDLANNYLYSSIGSTTVKVTGILEMLTPTNGIRGNSTDGLILENSSSVNSKFRLGSAGIYVKGTILGDENSPNGVRLQADSSTGGASGGGYLELTSSAGVTVGGPMKFQPVTTTQRDNLPTKTAGMVIWNTSTTKLQVYTGSAWDDLN